MKTSEAKNKTAYFYAEMVKDTHLNGYAVHKGGFIIETMSVFDYILRSFEHGRYCVDDLGLGGFISKTGRTATKHDSMEDAEEFMFSSALNAFETGSTPSWHYSREDCIESIAEQTGTVLEDAKLLSEGVLKFAVAEGDSIERKNGTCFLAYEELVLETGSLIDALNRLSENENYGIPTELKRIVLGEKQLWTRKHFTDDMYDTFMKITRTDIFDHCAAAYFLFE